MTSPPEPMFRVSTEHDGDGLVIRASGELDLTVAADFEAQVRQALAGEEEVVTLHLGELTFIDSTGLRVLWNAVAAGSADGTRFRICHQFAPDVERTLELTGMTERLPLIG